MDISMDNYRIYVLRLQNEKYYVGKSQTINYCIGQHSARIASEWTTKYPMIDILITIDGDAFDEVPTVN